jgi:alkanesulfonate monooxygenase SsuD/methylene tetrahydromethanopterin reductase-like flavin-dependent oxidoreductase (luciferase family)
LLLHPRGALRRLRREEERRMTLDHGGGTSVRPETAPIGRPLAVSVAPLETRRETLLHVVEVADRLGYDAFLLPEAWSYDSTVLLAEAAMRTRRIRLGTGILSVWSRTAGTIAMAASTLHAVSGGRFLLGLGASTAQLTEGLHDVPFRAPVARVRRVVTQVRALLRGERIPLAVAANARPLRLGQGPVPEVPIYMAALAPASVRLAGELADGWLPFLFPRSRIQDGLRLLREGAARSDPDRSIRICPTIPTAVADNGGDARERAVWFLAFYLASMGELYRGTLARLGYGAEVEAVLSANPPRTPPVLPRNAEGLLDQLTIFGKADAARGRLAAWYAAGATMPVLLLAPDLTHAQIERTLRAFRE